MTNVDKAAIGWTVAIVAVGIAIALSGAGLALDSGAPTQEQVMLQEREEAMAEQKAMSQPEEREEAIAEQMETVTLEKEVTVSEPVVVEPPVMGPQTASVSMPSGSTGPGCENTNSCYVPFSTSINAGDTVIWTNDDTAPHTVTSGSPATAPDEMFESGLMMAGDSFEFTFDDAGSYEYFCMVHPWMTGNVQVS